MNNIKETRQITQQSFFECRNRNPNNRSSIIHFSFGSWCTYLTIDLKMMTRYTIGLTSTLKPSCFTHQKLKHWSNMLYQHIILLLYCFLLLLLLTIYHLIILKADFKWEGRIDLIGMWKCYEVLYYICVQGVGFTIAKYRIICRLWKQRSMVIRYLFIGDDLRIHRIIQICKLRGFLANAGKQRT
jgi:hypothetical protein